MNINILSFSEFSVVNEKQEPINERVEIFELSKQARSKQDFRNKVIAKLSKEAPLLADDENFVNSIVDTYQESEPAK